MSLTPNVSQDGAQFPQTRWSIVANARNDNPKGRAALETLCQTYWVPLYAFVRRSGYSEHDAKDHTQEFFRRLIEKGYLNDVAEHKGKLRSFLRVSIKHFLLDEAKHRKAAKRGGGRVPVSLDHEFGEARYKVEPVDNVTPEDLFERQWAISVVEGALNALESEYAGDGRRELFEKLSPFLQWNSGGKTYASIADDLQMTEGAVKVAVYRIRRRYRRMLREQVADTVADGDDIDEELRRMLRILG